jgi:hypothetical protein
MTLEQRINDAVKWAKAMRVARGSMSSSYEDGIVKAVSTPDTMTVTITLTVIDDGPLTTERIMAAIR